MAIGGGSGGDPRNYFLRKGLVTPEQFDAARREGGDIVERLLESGLIGERDVWMYRAQGMGLAFADLEGVQIHFQATLCLPSDLCRELGILPLRLDGDTLWVGARDPRDGAALARAAEVSGCRIIPVVVVPTALETALARL